MKVMMAMDSKILKELRNASLAFNCDGDFIFTVRNKNGETKTYGPFNFGEAMRICWEVYDYFKDGGNFDNT